MNNHLSFLQDLDNWFASVLSRYPAQMKCARGCALCCHGLFDISLPDALLLSQGLNALSPEVLQEVQARAAPIQATILRLAPGLKAPFILDQITETRIDEIVEQAASPPCPLLGARQECLVYESRPLACRLEGVPMADTRDGLFGD
jgi:Fe-S-cluster containining protein